MTSGHSAHRGPANGCPTAVGYGGYTRTWRVTAAVGAMAAAMAGKVLPLAAASSTGMRRSPYAPLDNVDERVELAALDRRQERKDRRRPLGVQLHHLPQPRQAAGAR